MQDIGHTGLNNLLVAYEDKGAKAVCTFGFSQGPGHEPILFQGITDVSFERLDDQNSPRQHAMGGIEGWLIWHVIEQGKIVPARGPTNFGWDAIFEYDGQT